MAKGLEEYPRNVQAAVLAGIAIVLGAFAGWYVVWPRAQGCLAKRTAIQVQHGRNVGNRIFEQQRPLYRKRLQDAQAELDDLRSKVPDDADSAGLVRLVHEAENVSGVHVRSLTVQPPVSSDIYMEFPAKLHVDGDYAALTKFFDHVAQSARITNVSGLTLAVASRAGSGTYALAPRETVSAEFVLSTYCNRAAAAPPAAAKK